MRLRKPPRPFSVEEWVQYNRERIVNPSGPGLRDRFMVQVFRVEEWWCRHVTQRELYRLLDSARLVKREEWPGPAVMFQRLRAGWDAYPELRHILPDPDALREKLREDSTSYPEHYPWGDDDDRK
jgi:hypothetical protein